MRGENCGKIPLRRPSRAVGTYTSCGIMTEGGPLIVDFNVQPRNFVVVGHTVTTSPDFLLEDLAGGTGRLDVLLRCVNSALMLSHGLRRDTQIFLLLLGGATPRCIRFVGPEARNLNPDERSTASLVKKALKRRVVAGESQAHPGVYVSEVSFESLLFLLARKTSIVELSEDGDDLRAMIEALPEDALPGVLRPEAEPRPYTAARQDFEEFSADYEVEENELGAPDEEEKPKEVIILGSRAGVIPLGPTTASESGGGKKGGGDIDWADDEEGPVKGREGSPKGPEGSAKEKTGPKKESAGGASGQAGKDGGKGRTLAKGEKPAGGKKGPAGASPIAGDKPLTFVMGDHLDLTPTEMAMMKAAGSVPASLGPLSLHADHCIIIVHNILDRRGFL
jgi:tRNA pseudouridine-54 N-methylase